MDFEEIRYQEIEDYLKGRLSEEETLSFEEKISSDKQLAQEVAVQKVALQSLELAYIQSMSNLVRNRVQQNNTTKKYWFGGGAILLIGLVISSSYLIVTSNQTKVAQSDSIDSIEKIASKKINSAIVKADKKNNIIPSTKYGSASVSMSDSTSKVEIVNETQNTQTPDRRLVLSETKSEKQTDAVKSTHTTQQTTATITCPENAPQISVRLSPTSFDEPSGSISINITDNWNVYLKGANTKYENNTQFVNLSAGTYTLYVQNENNCIFQIGTYAVINSNCSFEKNYVFNKQFDTEWKIPGPSNTSYQLSVFNKGGIEVYSENVPANSNGSWNGLNKNGENVAIGLHKVIVTYSDNKTCIYNVVVSE